MKKHIKSIHSLLGLIFAVPILLIGISGALLSYEAEILKALNPQTYTINLENKKQIDKKTLFKNLEKEYNAAIYNVRILGENAPITLFLRPNVIDRLDEKSPTRYTLYIDPYTGQKLAPPENGRDFFRFIRQMHIFLLLGGVGNEIVGISTLYLIFLCISGFILYFKFLRHNFKNAVKIDFKAKGTKFYYKFHSVFGVALFVVFLIVSISGLYWSYDWVRNGIHYVAKVETNSHRHARANLNEMQPRFSYAKHLNLDNLTKAMKIFTKNYDYKNFRILRHEKTDAFKIIYLPKNAPHSRATNQLIIHPNGTIMQNGKYKYQTIGTKFVRSMLMIHSGEFFGSVFKAIFCFASAFLAVFVWSGFYLWRSKKIKRQI